MVDVAGRERHPEHDVDAAHGAQLAERLDLPPPAALDAAILVVANAADDTVSVIHFSEVIEYPSLK